MAAAISLGDPEARAEREATVQRALAALATPDLGASLELAEEAKKMEKGTLYRQIEALASALADAARETVNDGSTRADVAARRHAVALSALQSLDGNASAQLTVEAMLIRMRSV